MNKDIIETYRPHTVKKFELVNKYVESWIQKLLNSGICNEIVYIDCMCNCGLSYNENNEIIEATPIRVAKTIRDAMFKYKDKKATLYFNDISEEKIKVLKEHLPKETENFKYEISAMDVNDFLNKYNNNHFRIGIKPHFLLFYDPYLAKINWKTLFPFINNWGEIIINHMVSDPIRAISQVKKQDTIDKYQNTYLLPFDEIMPFGTNKNNFEERIECIIKTLSNKQIYVASFPFFDKFNNLKYYLIHLSKVIEGFKLYKTTAWKTFGGRSSMKKTYEKECYRSLLFEDENVCSDTDINCFNVYDIAKYLYKTYKGQTVPLNDVWKTLDIHPIFPSDGFKKEIKNELKKCFNVIINRSSIMFIGE